MRAPLQCLLPLLLLPAFAVAQTAVPSTEKGDALLGPDDSITVLVLNCEEISKEWQIGATGDVSFPLIGRLHLAGLTREHAEALIAGKLARYVKDPQVTVHTTTLRSRPFTVAGAVEKPGRYQMSSPTTLLDALVLAGGPKNAGSTVMVKRSMAAGPIQAPGVKVDKDGEYALVEFDLKSVMDGPNGPAPVADFQLQPLDVVTVSPSTAPRLVHIVGEVARPGAIELVTQETMSLMKLIAVAGGLTNTASTGNALIMHINADGIQTATGVVNVKRIMQGKVKDLDLIAGDIVLIPSSRVKSLSSMLTSTGMNAGLTTAIFMLGRY